MSINNDMIEFFLGFSQGEFIFKENILEEE